MQDFLTNDICIYTKDRISKHPLRKCNSRSEGRRHWHTVDDICRYIYVVMTRGNWNWLVTVAPTPPGRLTANPTQNFSLVVQYFMLIQRRIDVVAVKYLWQSFISFIGLSWLTATSTTILGYGAPFPMNFKQPGGGWGMLFWWRWNEVSGRLTERLFNLQSMTIRTINKGHTIVWCTFQPIHIITPFNLTSNHWV